MIPASSVTAAELLHTESAFAARVFAACSCNL